MLRTVVCVCGSEIGQILGSRKEAEREQLYVETRLSPRRRTRGRSVRDDELSFYDGKLILRGGQWMPAQGWLRRESGGTNTNLSVRLSLTPDGVLIRPLERKIQT